MAISCECTYRCDACGAETKVESTAPSMNPLWRISVSRPDGSGSGASHDPKSRGTTVVMCAGDGVRRSVCESCARMFLRAMGTEVVRAEDARVTEERNRLERLGDEARKDLSELTEWFDSKAARRPTEALARVKELCAKWGALPF